GGPDAATSIRRTPSSPSWRAESAFGALPNTNQHHPERRFTHKSALDLVIRALPVVSGFARVFMSVALCPSRLPHNRWSAFVGLSTLRFPEIPEEPKKKDAGDVEDRCHARE